MSPRVSPFFAGGDHAPDRPSRKFSLDSPYFTLPPMQASVAPFVGIAAYSNTVCKGTMWPQYNDLNAWRIKADHHFHVGQEGRKDL